MLPNTFYAKVGSPADQRARELVYLRISLLDWGAVLFLAAVAWAVLFGLRRHASVYAFLAFDSSYVVAVGDDVFHFLRFWVPVVPVLVALACAATVMLFHRARATSDRIAVAAVVALALVWCLRTSLADVQAH